MGSKQPHVQRISDKGTTGFLAGKTLKSAYFCIFTFVFSLPALTFAVLSQNCGMVTTVEVETKFKG
jgi:hypothetical protein